ncbi:MAG: DEAD/DEAH box helicase [Anaerolineaceae bacterium]|nr:DEAD/DEAH box helicase [Anaerolineaceae bacterium]
MSFNTFSFHPQIDAGISKAGYTSPTPIQSKTIPAILSGKDVLGLAQTGTGKTAAFVLPMLEKLMKGPRGKLRGLIISPTRELAEQIHHSIVELGRQTGLRSITVFGGVSAQPQIKALRGGVDIVVACPGRLLDLKSQRAINLSRIEILVLDEADHMFDMGFLPSIRRIVDAVPEKRQTLLFSATMPDEIRSLATEMLYNPETVEIGITQPIDTISHAIYPVDQMRKTEMLQKLLRQSGDGQVLVFTRTKHRAKKLAYQLTQAGLSATSLQGNLSQNQRKAAMDSFRKGRVKVMVATDIAARGIDVSKVSHVINFDIPDTADAYTHRTGRTGRMEQLGTALTLVTPDDQTMVRTIERVMGKSLERRKMDGFEVNMNVPSQPRQQQNRNTRSNNNQQRQRSNSNSNNNGNRSRSYAGHR